MLPAFLITYREVIEASLIVATILGILTKLGQKNQIKTVWFATGAATLVSISLLILGSILGFNVQKIYSGKVEETIEGIFMVMSAIFITWAVFFLHKYFSRNKIHLIKKIKEQVEKEEQRGLFLLVFSAVFREGFEIVLFLSTIYFSSDPQSILTGFIGGTVLGLLTSSLLFAATLRLPVFYAFRTTSILLILFAAGLFARGAHEFAEVGIIPEIGKITFVFIPSTATYMGNIIKTIFGLTRNMDVVQVSLYSTYTFFMLWWVFFKKRYQNATG
ncbi:MAG: FTR1 family protein [Patescibacteria group bacterium]